jgi:nucleoside-triphosphatase
MANNILIAGAPGIGKTSLISRLYRDLTPLVIKEYQILKGYRLATFDFQELVLAHIHIVGPDRFEDFGLNLDGFDKLVINQFSPDPNVELFLVDEIGMMECTSLLFRQTILKLINSDVPLIATLASLNVLDILKIRNRKDISVLNMTHKNREFIWKDVLVEISRPIT